MSDKQPFDLKKTIDDLIDLAKEYFNLRTLFDFNMDVFTKLLPEKYFEKGMEFGKQIIDKLIYSIW